MIYTFYSFKGGVGRSMALANIAELLYLRGLKVLMVDFDLEAPGLERYFNVPNAMTKPQEVLSKRGVIDMLLSYLELRSLPCFDTVREVVPETLLQKDEFPHRVEPLKEFLVPIYEKNALGGELSLIPAGRRDGDEFTAYAQRIRSFDWDDFYVSWDGEAFFEWFRREAEAVADVILIDSRTGVSEMSGVCTYQLADAVIMFVAPNRQNLEGTVMMAESLSRPKLIEQGRRGRPLSLLFVPSRVEYGEAKLLDEFAREFDERLSSLLPAVREFESAGFEDLKLIYVPHYAYMEKVAVREPERASASELIKAYEKIAVALAQLDPEDSPLRQSYYPATVKRRARIFLSYKRVEPDESVARRLYLELSQSHDVFFDQAIPIGKDWVRSIEENLEQADFLILLISAASVDSHMLWREIEHARSLAKSRGGKPAILPVRMGYSGALPYPLGAYLDRIQYAYWEGYDDTPRLIEDLLNAISSGEVEVTGRMQLAEAAQLYSRESPLSLPPPNSVRPLRLEAPGAPVDPQSAFYVARAADSIALDAINRVGTTIIIKGPRRMGKSSLLIRIVEAAERANKRVAFLDFQLMEHKVLQNPELFFRVFCQLITESLDLEDQTERFWDSHLSRAQCCTRYLSKYVLVKLSQPLVLAMDEVDLLLNSDFRRDFFAMLRVWHNSRAHPGRKEWKNVDLVLAASSEPYQFIDSLKESPFNVGQVLQLGDFTREQVIDLNQRHGSPLHPSELRQLIDLVGGHPYLVRKALYLLASGELTFYELFSQSINDNGPFDDHLRLQLWKLHGDKELARGLLEVISQHTCSDERVFFRLHGEGLVRRDGRTVLPSCRLYGDYFKERLA